MKTLKKLFFILLILNIGNSLFAAKNLTDAENKMVLQTLQMRFDTRKCSTSDSAIKSISDFETKIKSSAEWKTIGDEAKLIVENMIVQEKYSYVYEKNATDSSLKNMIMTQYNKIIAWNENHKTDEKNKWYILSSGDVINSTMQYLPQSTAIKLGLQEKDDYDALLEKYPTFSFALINAGLWYYFAPSIGGGSTKKAGEYFLKAYNNATTDFEKYYASIYLSQFYFESKDFSSATKYLTVAQNMIPNGRYVTFIKKLNTNNFSLLYYTNNREKVEKKLQ